MSETNTTTTFRLNKATKEDMITSARWARGLGGLLLVGGGIALLFCVIGAYTVLNDDSDRATGVLIGFAVLLVLFGASLYVGWTLIQYGKHLAHCTKQPDLQSLNNFFEQQWYFWRFVAIYMGVGFLLSLLSVLFTFPA